MQLQLLEHRQFELAGKIAALRGRAAGGGNADGANSSHEGRGSGAGGGSGSGHEEGEEEKEEQPGSHPNIIGNAEEMEAEQQEMHGSNNGSGPNVASPFVRMQAQDPVGLSSAVNAARQRQANARRGAGVSDFSAAQRGFQNMNL